MSDIAERWGTDEERDRRHEEVMRRFPGGLSWEQFVYCTLESARDEGDLIEFPSLTINQLDSHSLALRMFMDGLIVSRGGYHSPLRWRITRKGRDRFAELQSQMAQT